VGGVAKKHPGDYGSFLFGAFVESGWGKFDIGDDVHDVNGQTSIVTGKGTLSYLGLGLMARQAFSNNFRIEASLRGGVLENKFKTTVPDEQGHYGSYNFRTPYLAAHLGLAYTLDINELSSLDFVLRGYWSRLKGKSVYIHPSEIYDKDHINFSDTDSWRVRAGLRYARRTPNGTYWYVGGYYDHEFDQKFTAFTNLDNFKLDTPALKGGTGIFEIGLVSHPTDSKTFSVEFGFQGYVGQISGLSGGVRLGWEF
jgi:hypothetical protein